MTDVYPFKSMCIILNDTCVVCGVLCVLKWCGLFVMCVCFQDNDPVAQALQQCERWVLRPYRVVLRCVSNFNPYLLFTHTHTHTLPPPPSPQLGWTQFTRDGDKWWQFALRMCLVVLWTLFLIATSLTQILSCFPRDRVR